MGDTKPQSIQIEAKDEKDAQEQTARLCVSPIANTAIILANTNKGLSPELMQLMDAVKDELNKLVKGDTTSIEKILMAQALTLQSLFANYTCKMTGATLLSQLQIYSKIALKAQNQCRQTLANLADIKNPNRTTFIKNTATNQQVNFNANSPEKNQNKSNELLSEEHHAPMDITGTATTSGTNQKLATLEA